jgi:two-component system sensor histidine kinase HydH
MGRFPGRPSEGDDFLCFDDCSPQGRSPAMRDQELVVFVGMDIAPYEQARSVDFQGTLLTSATCWSWASPPWCPFLAQSHRVSKRLLRDRAFASEVVGNMPAAQAVVDPAGSWPWSTPPWRRFLGRASPDIVGRPAAGVLPEALLRLGQGPGPRPGPPAETGASSTSGGAARAPGRERDPHRGRGRHRGGHAFLLRDLREVRALEEEVRRREKLPPWGNLAAGWP